MDGDLKSFWAAQSEWSQRTFGTDTERGPAGPLKAPVSGSVTLDGKPLDEGTIYFKTVQQGSVDRMDIKEKAHGDQVH